MCVCDMYVCVCVCVCVHACMQGGECVEEAGLKPKWCTLTREYSGHHSGKHEEQHTEEETAGIVESLGGLVADAQVQQANQNAHS